MNSSNMMNEQLSQEERDGKLIEFRRRIITCKIVLLTFFGTFFYKRTGFCHWFLPVKNQIFFIFLILPMIFFRCYPSF
jgi:hypothetical protein